MGNCPGPEKCGGCYSVGVIDGEERFIRPPVSSPEWKKWLKQGRKFAWSKTTKPKDSAKA